MSHETNPDSRPLPEGWLTEYSPEWNAWYYVNTKSGNPQAVWTHPIDGESPTVATSPSLASGSHNASGSTPSAPAPSPAAPTNPDTRPLPGGWISEYSPDHKTFFYVNTKAADPNSTVTWTHPAETNASTTHGPTAATGGRQNPDSRPLPPGWITDYAENFGAWYYVNTRDANPTATWSHPVDTLYQQHTASPPSTSHAPAPAPVAATSPAPPYPGPSPQKMTTPLPASTGQQAPPTSTNSTNQNPDQRPLPAGWIAKFDENYKTWYYIDTTKPGGPSSWEHPSDKQGTAPAPAPPTSPTYGGYQPGGASGMPPTTAPAGSAPGTGAPQNPDKRPLPAGWVSQYDRNTNKWFYVNTTQRPPVTSWDHPAGKTATMPGQQTGMAQTPGGQQSSAGSPPGSATSPTGGTGLEGLLGGKAGGMIGGLFGSKGRAQMDSFANMVGSEITRYKSQHGKSGVPAPSQAPPGPGPSQYQPPLGQAPGQAVPPPTNQPPPSTIGGLAGKFGFGKK